MARLGSSPLVAGVETECTVSSPATVPPASATEEEEEEGEGEVSANSDCADWWAEEQEDR